MIRRTHDRIGKIPPLCPGVLSFAEGRSEWGAPPRGKPSFPIRGRIPPSRPVGIWTSKGPRLPSERSPEFGQGAPSSQTAPIQAWRRPSARHVFPFHVGDILGWGSSAFSKGVAESPHVLACLEFSVPQSRPPGPPPPTGRLFFIRQMLNVFETTGPRSLKQKSQDGLVTWGPMMDFGEVWAGPGKKSPYSPPPNF